MTRCRFLVASCVGTFFYVLIAVFCGRDGLWAYSQLMDEKRSLSTHTASIEKTYEELLLEKAALQSDMDVIASYARKLGFVSEGEKLVKITGLPLREKQILDPGMVVFHNEVKYIPEWFCKVLGLIIFALVYLVLLLSDFNRGLIELPNRKAHVNVIRGVPVYDMQ